MLFGPQGPPAELSTNLNGDKLILDFPNAISPTGLNHHESFYAGCDATKKCIHHLTSASFTL